MDHAAPHPATPSDQYAQLQDLLLLQRVVQRINSIHDLDVLLEQIVDDVKETFGYSRSGVLFLDEATNELVIVAVRGWTINYHVKGDRFKVGWGMIGHAAEMGRTHYAPDVSKDPHYMVSEESTLSEVDIPIFSRGKLIGIFNAQHAEVDAFPPHRIQLLESLADHLGIAVENARMFERERLERERMTKDLEEARAIQARLFPKAAPDVPGFRLSGLSMPCFEVGGDWFDYIPLQEGRTGIVLGDVAGKGPGAALLMTSARSILRMYAEREVSPAAALTGVSRVLSSDMPAGRFVTMIYAVLDSSNRTLTFANAGHHPPLHVNAAGAHLVTTPPALPLGVRGATYSEHRLTLEPGDRVFLYSDGLVEARNHESDEYGTERLLRDAMSPTASAEELVHAVELHADGRPMMDDVTIVLIDATDAPRLSGDRR